MHSLHQLFYCITIGIFTLILGACDNHSRDTKDESVFTYAMSGMYRPFNFMQDGQLQGFDVDIGQALSERMGYVANPITNPWETIIQGLRTGNYQAIIGSMAVTEQRAEQVNFSRPYYRSGAQIFISEETKDISGPQDLARSRVGVVRASTFRDIALELTAEPNQVVGYDSDIVALMDLTTGRIQAVITDQVVGLAAIHDHQLALQPVGAPLFTDAMAIAVHRGDQHSLTAINQALEEIIADGTYDEISQKWFGRNILGE